MNFYKFLNFICMFYKFEWFSRFQNIFLAKQERRIWQNYKICKISWNFQNSTKFIHTNFFEFNELHVIVACNSTYTYILYILYKKIYFLIYFIYLAYGVHLYLQLFYLYSNDYNSNLKTERSIDRFDFYSNFYITIFSISFHTYFISLFVCNAVQFAGRLVVQQVRHPYW